ncbi:MAG: DUF3854 domain-containing protein [Hydrococcus sp. RU_2_2]|nr:DUF3854 domain-containing protein [Hydrococcus sp. RU_2_2]NJP20389.1 DUF3854 domain-containing protein [Hydrococcus sp. CRU_1_1]
MNHLIEWQKSCVDEQLISLNVTALDGSAPSEHLLYSDALPRRNDGRLSDRILKRYEHTEEGGWWCSGIDLLTGSDDLWGCFKPARPRLSNDRHKPIKYEHPPQTPTGIFALKVPLHLWQNIADRAGSGIISQEIDFWQWLIEHPSIPLCITEGAKKAGALLTAGYAAIALPGINNGYRTPRNERGDRIGKSHLIAQLEKLVASGRQIYIAFDRDTKTNTIKAVDAAIAKMGYLLKQAGCSVKVITWNPEFGKGVDDLIARNGRQAFDKAYQIALPFDTWKAQGLARLTHTSNIEVNCRYLPDLEIPQTAKLIGIKSPKGTGKTKCLEQIVARAKERGQWVLVIGHRIRLVEELCQRFGLQYITEVRNPLLEQVLGYGLCIDSLHPNSQAKFNALNWSNGIVIIDEVEQVLWHGLNSDTCRNNRVAILKSLKTLMQNVLGGDGQVYVADADLSDISLDYLMTLGGLSLESFIVKNDWKPSEKEAWNVYNYPESNPKVLVRNLVKHIKEGGKPFVCLSAQKLTSQWGTRTLESYLKKQFPQANILRIDSESLTEPTHPAYNCINNLDRVLSSYDIVLASPSIETGVSIALKGHFTSVWSIAQGIQTVTSICQALGRIRENIPRHIWVASYGFNQIANGSTSIPALLTSGHRLTELNIRLLQQSDFDALDDIDAGFQAESLLCWAKMAVRVNASMINYRDSVQALLIEEGHNLKVGGRDAIYRVSTEIGNQENKKNSQNHNLYSLAEAWERVKSQNQLTDAINEVREQNYQAECNAIARANDLNEEQYRALKRRLVKTISQKRSLRKHELKNRYELPITPQLVALDDDNWYQKLRIHYFLTIGRSYLADRDAIVAKQLIDRGHGSLFFPDFNGSQLGTIIGTMEVLGIPILLADSSRELRNTDDDLQQLAKIAMNNRTEIKTIIGIGIAKNASPIVIIRRFLEEIGYGLMNICCEGTRQKRIRVYRVVVPNDGREEVFKQWLLKDERYPGSSEPWLDDGFIANYYRNRLCHSSHSNRSLETPNNNYIQLSLDLGTI